MVLCSLKVYFHFVSPSPLDLSSPVFLLIMNPQILLKSIEMMILVVEYISQRIRKKNPKNQMTVFFPHSQLLDLRFISWPITSLFPLISSENIHVRSAMMAIDWGNIYEHMHYMLWRKNLHLFFWLSMDVGIGRMFIFSSNTQKHLPCNQLGRIPLQFSLKRTTADSSYA